MSRENCRHSMFILLAKLQLHALNKLCTHWVSCDIKLGYFLKIIEDFPAQVNEFLAEYRRNIECEAISVQDEIQNTDMEKKTEK